MYICSGGTTGHEVGANVSHSSSDGRCSHRETLGRGDRIKEARYSNGR